MADISNDELKVLVEQLSKDLAENTAINKELLELLRVNNKHTDEVWKYVNIELSTEQQWKNFGANIAANLIGNSIAVPTIIDTRPLFQK